MAPDAAAFDRFRWRNAATPPRRSKGSTDTIIVNAPSIETSICWPNPSALGLMYSRQHAHNSEHWGRKIRHRNAHEQADPEVRRMYTSFHLSCMIVSIALAGLESSSLAKAVMEHLYTKPRVHFGNQL